ncbi:MAG: hypothetical protein JXB48_09515 [Candidatus Latescibacteria bacterium]|nr:hypothetical protein [Candidatus Latescibacterota bacterium]
MRIFLISYCLAVISLFLPGTSACGLIMHTHGHITIAPYIHGFNNSKHLYPGYRSEFMTHVDFFSIKGVIFNSLLGTTTLISKPDGEQLKMDRIRYTLTPGLRYEFGDFLLKGTLHHECIHRISSPEFKGSIWWNSFQVGVGTKGAYYLYLREEFKNSINKFLNAWDAQLNFGYIVPAKNTLVSGQNHDYQYELFSLIRYELGTFGKYAYFASFRQHLWGKSDDSPEHKIDITLNLFRKGTVNFAGLFYNYTIYDTFSLDNYDGLSSLGFKIIF